jgi:hypothetical protein
MNNELQLHDDRKDLTVPQMLQTVIQGGVTAENAAAFEKLIELHWKMQERDAEKEFNAAFVALQKDMPVIVASSVIPNRGKYEKYEDVMKVVSPLLSKHGFSVSFSNDAKDNRITETCHLRHIGGHSQSNPFTVRVSGKADSETQADCKAATTAKRNALLNCLAIVIRQDCLQDEDNDPRNEGSVISEEQAFELERRVNETNSDVEAFLKLAGAKQFGEIMSGKYAMLDAMLKRKESRGR